MNNSPNISSKGKGLLLIAFMIGLCSFMGFAGTAANPLRQVDNTELVVRSGKHVKRADHITFVTREIHKTRIPDLFTKQLLQFHQRLIETKLYTSNLKVLGFSTPVNFLQVKRISQNFGKEAPHLFRG